MQDVNLLGSKGVNINVGIDNQDLLLLIAGIFFAVVAASVVTHLIVKSL